MSWIITRKSDGKAIMETFSASVAVWIRRDRYNVEEAGAYLRRINSEIKERSGNSDY